MGGAHDTLTPSSCSGGTPQVSLHVYFIDAESSLFPWAKLHLSVGFQRASASGTWEKPKSDWQWREDATLAQSPRAENWERTVEGNPDHCAHRQLRPDSGPFREGSAEGGARHGEGASTAHKTACS